MRYRLAYVVLILLMAAGCRSSSIFVPLIGPYIGNFFVDGMPVGTMTLTTDNGLLGGTGSLTHNAQPVTVSLSATITDRAVSGTVVNSSLGSGTIVGTFDKFGNLSGQFEYEDFGQISTTSGTWSAEIEGGSN